MSPSWKMFNRTVWIFFVLCFYVHSAQLSRNLNKNSFAEIQVKHKIHQNERVHTFTPEIKSGETRVKRVRTKRGIVMVDSDFDIPSEIFIYENNMDSDNVFGKDDGSGNDGFDDKESITTTTDDIKLESEYQRTTNKKTAALTQSSTAAMAEYTKKQINASTDTEGSGDDLISFTEEYPTTDTTVKTHMKSQHDYPERIPDICLNSTCSIDDASISVSEVRHFIPEGTNITLTCKSNSSNHNILYWYKSNGTGNILQAFSTDEELQLNVQDARSVQSGVYLCVKWVNKESCCNVQRDIIIYEVPFYQYHLLVLGVIAITALLICIFLTIRQSVTLKVYTQQFAEKHGSVKNQLL